MPSCLASAAPPSATSRSDLLRGRLGPGGGCHGARAVACDGRRTRLGLAQGSPALRRRLTVALPGPQQMRPCPAHGLPSWSPANTPTLIADASAPEEQGRAALAVGHDGEALGLEQGHAQEAAGADAGGVVQPQRGVHLGGRGHKAEDYVIPLRAGFCAGLHRVRVHRREVGGRHAGLAAGLPALRPHLQSCARASSGSEGLPAMLSKGRAAHPGLVHLRAQPAGPAIDSAAPKADTASRRNEGEEESTQNPPPCLGRPWPAGISHRLR